MEEIFIKYLGNKNVNILSASFGIAGPVKDRRVEATNLPWVITEDSLRSTVDNAPVFLLNDLFASANALPHLNPEDIHTINTGLPQTEGALGLVSPGTGLGEAFLTWDGEGYQAHPSEGGHCSFVPTNSAQVSLLNYLMPKFGHISFERVCSGNGIPSLYAYIKKLNQSIEPERLRREMIPNYWRGSCRILKNGQTWRP